MGANKSLFVCAAFVVVSVCAWAVAQTSAEEPLTQATIKVRGLGTAPEGKRGTPQGKLMAERAAEVVAKRNLGLAVGKVSVEGDERQKTVFVEAFVRGARTTDTKVLPDGSVEVTMELPLSEVAKNFADMQRVMIQAEENRKKLDGVFKKTEEDLRTVKGQLNNLQGSMQKIETQIKSLEGR